MTPKYQAVIFDLDGTLVATERFGELWQQTFDATFKEYGVTPKHGQPYTGRRVADNVRVLKAENNIQASFEEIMGRLHKNLHERIPEVVLLPGAQEFVREVRQHDLRTALTTSSTREYVDALLPVIEFTDAFNVICTGEQVERGKPAPDIYLRTLELLQVPASACVVIEDSINGARAAIAAKIPTIVVPTAPGIPKEKFEGALAIVGAIRDARPLIFEKRAND